MTFSRMRIIPLAIVAAITISANLMTATLADASTAPHCTLSVARDGSNSFEEVKVDCSFSGGETFSEFKVYGSDPWYDDYLVTANRIAGQGDQFQIQRTFDPEELNEDIGRDELYAKARLVRPDGSEYFVRTNTVIGYFGA